MVPLWQRTKKLSSPYANVAIDCVYSIFWVAALASVQVWTNSGITDSGGGYCAHWSFGDQDKCVISYGMVIVAVLVFLLWIVAAGVSGYSLFYYRKNGYLPNSRPSISAPELIEPTISRPVSHVKAEETLHPESRSASEPDLEKGSIHTETAEGTHPGRKLSWGQSPPMTAPSRFEIGTRPQFRQVSYESTNESSPLSPRRRISNRYATPPRLQLWGPGHSEPTVVADYGSISAHGPKTHDGRGAAAQSHGTGSSSAGVSSASSTHDGERRPVLRMPMPGPASKHSGGYNSAFHTPLPTAMMPTGNSWRDDMMKANVAPPAEFPKGNYSR